MSFSDRFISLSVMSSRSNNVVTCIKFSSILRLSNCMWYPFAYPVIQFMDIWTVSSFWLLWIMLLRTWAFKYLFCPCFHFFWVYTKKWNCWIIWSSMLSFLKKSPYYFPQKLYHFSFPPETHNGSNFSTFSPTFGVVLLIMPILMGMK